MDEVRRMKFIRQYDEKLQELLNREESETVKKAVSHYFYQLVNRELSKTQETMVHAPQEVVLLLSKFTEETHVKYATHLWDGTQDKGYTDYDHYIEKLNEDFAVYKFNRLIQFNKDLYWNLIFPFLFQKKPNIKRETGQAIPFSWGRHKLQVGWQYPEGLLRHPDKKPYDVLIPEKWRPDNLKGRQAPRYFQDFIDIFKSEIEFRRNEFFFLIKRITSDISSDFKINIHGIKGLSFYTYTQKVEDVLKRIFKNMDTNFPEISVTGSVDADSIRIEILQKGSYSDKALDDPKLNLAGGDFKIIYRNLFSLCDWSVQSRFRGGQYYEIRYLDARKPGSTPEKSILPEDPGGFKYILTFYTKVHEKNHNR